MRRGARSKGQQTGRKFIRLKKKHPIKVKETAARKPWEGIQVIVMAENSSENCRNKRNQHRNDIVIWMDAAYRNEVFVRGVRQVILSAAESGDSRQHTQRWPETARMQQVSQEIRK